ncbi:ABC transporter ATP-binding protein [Paracoccus aminophilus]|uniref:ABC cobalamin/Fe3+-siderophore transporter, ATPase subunit n=1 Tax=Paracoccus aminophilus JCM 7686 TaxID=1367847 RepID=S5Z200_PARAH|nr:ABC transporter ATP-binding protein [Paracoccus aminophilus]AGT11446.1 ABC cobalamin/Fe3+-siderophore transporter, ATPase subunit [Paracoccus aminophilus JCM 7686]
MKIEAQGLGWRSAGRSIVSGVDLALEPGETFGLIGPNGSGKSTLLRLIAGLLPRAEGQVRLNGTPLGQMARRDIARKIALVSQHVDTAETLSVRDAVELGRTPWLSAFSPFGAQDRQIVAAALEAVEITHLADQLWPSLSGGERQRVQIAKALAQSPELLILDEPTNHLDIHHQLSLLWLVGGLEMTVVMALHDLNQAMGCDRVGVMQGGRLIACGRPAEVISPELLSSTFRVAASCLTDPRDQSLLYRFHILENDR